jgi:hypothetical protein
MDEMVPATFKDAGSRDYSWYISEDESTVHIFERFVWTLLTAFRATKERELTSLRRLVHRYADAEACIEHGATFAPFGERFNECITWGDFYVFGDLDTAPGTAGAQFRESLKPLGAKFFVGLKSGQRLDEMDADPRLPRGSAARLCVLRFRLQGKFGSGGFSK